jgi:hypothetical protein
VQLELLRGADRFELDGRPRSRHGDTITLIASRSFIAR